MGLPDPLPLGPVEVTVRAKDYSGNTTDTTTTITVVDTTPPLLTVPEGITLTAESNAGISVNNSNIQSFLKAATAIDIVDSAPEIRHDAPDFFPVNTTIKVTFTATDASGNQATASFRTLWGNKDVPGAITATRLR